MPLKLIVTTEEKNTLPEAVRAYYKQVEGTEEHQLDVEGGAVSKSKLQEFRDKNIELQKELLKFNGIDPEKTKGLQDRITELEKELEGKIDPKLAKDNIDKVIEPIKANFLKKEDELNKRIESLTQEIEVFRIDNEIVRIALEGGLHEKATADIIARGRQIFKWEDGKLVPKNKDGGIIYSEDSAEPLTIKEWTKKLAKEAPFLFKGSSGGGADPDNAGGDGDENPWKKETHNLTKQGKLMKENPKKARQFIVAAGKEPKTYGL